MSGKGMDWDRMEAVLLGVESDEEWLHFSRASTPDYMWEHRQNMYESEEEDLDSYDFGTDYSVGDEV